MDLKVRPIELDAAGKTIAIINNHDAKELGVRPMERIIITKGNKKMCVIINTTADRFVKRGEIIVYHEVREALKLKNSDIVHAKPRGALESKKYIKEKVRGKELEYKKYKAIIFDVIQRNLNDLEISSLITALEINGMTEQEVYDVTKIIVETGKRVNFKGAVVDKHSVGGVPGDKTTLMFVPIIAASGLTIPKTSSRSITSAAGTADRMEALAPVEFSISQIKKIVDKTGGCIVWGGAVDLAPADDLFIQIEHPLNLDPLFIPSIMSKKISMGSKYLVIDMPSGPDAKIKTGKDFDDISKKFLHIAHKFGIKTRCVMTDARQPLGRNIGPLLEAREALENIIMPKEKNLINKVIVLSNTLMKLAGRKENAMEIIESGLAEEKLREIIKYQGGNEDIKPEMLQPGKFRHEIRSKESGRVKYINIKTIAVKAKMCGAPDDKKAGIIMQKQLNDTVKKHETLYTLYSESRNKMNQAAKGDVGFIVK
ncbi:MAG: thymidine phosphorylase [Candidatus Aenigmarchaeota archaeon]|uniref:AMP phosphorylase n=1 Tax=uncultured Aenigmarchaeota archaeon TaxID=1462426 RepID=A0A447ITZ5_9ARCH|nr:thymidine phosphorylase [Candidatus Aenigmarchaeota archaeon]VDS10983.1 AMP phosphorylase [uncultured Aenigmarchaeota archaeon]VDS10996.1 AMP phosphorylase [uncultured Aenigmarchaeota archaeon]VDS11009.1 AMP phosphorylase [uncultured Aenigmarchaeota archaeon]VDS11013.1 AMP phosphorylase [uncultured Aenigmarchaeota archaeon]